MLKSDQRESLMGRPKRLLSILVADDTPANLKMVRRVLCGRGHHFVAVNNGKNAVAKFQRGRFDVILMDVQMPVMDGYEATRTIRELELLENAHTPIIALTSHSGVGDREKCLEAGMDAFLNKPIEAVRLIKLVEDLADSRRTDSMPVAAVRTDGEPPSLVDFDGAMKRLGGDRQLFRDFITVFDEDSPALLSNLREAFDARDAPGARRSAHGLKGLAANFGATAVTDAAAEIEGMTDAGNWAEAKQTLDQLDHAVSQLNRALDEYRK